VRNARMSDTELAADALTVNRHEATRLALRSLFMRY
jgi:hypothetical protein